MSMKLISRAEYLKDHNVNAFVNYLRGLIEGGEFKHSYILNKSKGMVEFKSFADAKMKYRWPENKNAKDFNKTKTLLKELSLDLRNAFNAKDEKAAFVCCVKILEWGGVESGVHGIAKLYCEDSLIENISTFLNLINQDTVDLTDFHKNGFRMNSSFTKIYSLLSCKPFVIYDSRVAAALGLIAKSMWLNENSDFPNLLQFALPEARTGKNKIDPRNPSDGVRINFPRLPSGPNKEIEHTKWNIYTNWIIEEALRNVNEFGAENSLLDKVRAVESSLFMIGYDVRQSANDLTPCLHDHHHRKSV